MPYVSSAQRRYFHANKSKLERQGVNVDEWDKASAGKKTPERVKNGKPVKNKLIQILKKKGILK